MNVARPAMVALILLSVGCRESTPGEGGIAQPGVSHQAAASAETGPRLSDHWLRGRLEQLQASHPDVPGFALAVAHQGRFYSAATGAADPDGRAMTADTPVRQASITKTLVAASMLRLFEREQVDLKTPISALIDPGHAALLTADGYVLTDIRVRDLLMHSGGVNDHFGSEQFTQAVLSDPQRIWTRTEQLAFMTRVTDPIEGPAPRFSYSDSGYLLLGEAIETLTGMGLGEAVADLNRFESIGLAASYWEGQAPPDPAGPGRAHQFMDGLDTFAIHGSVDAFGGGGWIASVEDVARYFDALFDGEVFDQVETLNLMIEAPGHPEGSPYRIGLFEREAEGIVGYGHGGFWGSDVVVYPALDLVIAGVALEPGGTDGLRELGRDLLRVLSQ